jgi:hypothetical protein
LTRTGFPVTSSGWRAKLQIGRVNRRELLARAGWLGIGAYLGPFPTTLLAAELTVLDVAYAGSMGSLMEGALKKAVEQTLKLELHGRSQGANALAQLIVSGSIRPDVFIPITPGPMLTVLRSGKVEVAHPLELPVKARWQGDVVRFRAAAILGLSTRQTRRLLAAYRDGGGGGALIHKARGRTSNNRLIPGIREYVIELVRSRYAEFDPSLASEVLHQSRLRREAYGHVVEGLNPQPGVNMP